MSNRYSITFIDDRGQVVPMREEVEGRNGSGYSLNWGVEIPVDYTTGKPTGERQYKPLTISKPICQSSPISFQKLVEGKVINQVLITFFYNSGKAGADETPFYQLVFENVQIIGHHISLDAIDTNRRAIPALETLSLVSQKVIHKEIEVSNNEYGDEYSKKSQKNCSIPGVPANAATSFNFKPAA